MELVQQFCLKKRRGKVQMVHMKKGGSYETKEN
jgi:hypothetical protein